MPISRSSADQRMGRCGRVENGVCIRLYTEEDYANRPRFTPPEILRANLAEVILRMIALKLGDIADFPFIDRPAEKSIQDGFDLLVELGAIDVRDKNRKSAVAYRLTENGRTMARLPIDPRLSRMLIEADKEDCLGPDRHHRRRPQHPGRSRAAPGQRGPGRPGASAVCRPVVRLRHRAQHLAGDP